MASEIPSYTIVKPCGLVDSAVQGRIVASQDDAFTSGHTISRHTLAQVLQWAVQLPTSEVTDLRFDDLCIDDGQAHSNQDFSRVFADARRVARN